METRLLVEWEATEAVDHHCHPLRRRPFPMSAFDLRTVFTEALDQRVIHEHTPCTAAYRADLRRLGDELGCLPVEEAILDLRAGQDPSAYANLLLRRSRTGVMLLDHGFGGKGAFTAAEHSAEVGIPQREIIRLESLAESLLLRCEAPGVVTVFSLGGTIAMARTGDGQEGVVPTLTASQLVDAIPGLTTCGVTIEVRDFRQLPGASLSFDDVLGLAAEIDERVGAGTRGVVVTQGTDTIEETASVLDVVYGGDAPIVVTGAMRNPTMAGADGPASLLGAIQVAASPKARGLGCVVVFGDQIHAARHVRKTHTTSTAAFASPNTGPLGHLVEGQVCMLAHIERRAPLQLARSRRVRVGLLTMASVKRASCYETSMTASTGSWSPPSVPGTSRRQSCLPSPSWPPVSPWSLHLGSGPAVCLDGPIALPARSRICWSAA